ncbi:propionyl-coenzyme A carboxylase alpha polypeptide [Mesorhizobium sp. M2D.F.Ca.ET.185.01.1.1]|nr:propionyl-coenzyme A carboxylase alpha polypeptide [Mesorhizobium sp. M2D.F.Ca.ET.140.01.1.1]TGP13858.1 propionyl-coenzyme A carboxylase alpha polypeptide [Mesorhizobium sp. M2D.F.Ca.ET.233.01.1.1]TGP29185.1 propionyl-coenzyme A carboxylase alpha polypeptide [Mesorhizobium sp. M2D.F.Ca.ET.232.01.1.1]TGP53193.1 propionyl-coenzyme A carboxylase alpha polypeptide [Mesorhizobium sp. M2D.F.Ca.ET.226.01.1.1]TGP61819.1 propionyl-coenzyme A carboxylase alpha polypeptide [Mesorhizobium sp. M2D.F.Ca.E
MPAISPTRGEIDVSPAFANLRRGGKSAGGETANLPLVGEMPGRAEGGAKDRCLCG